MAAGVVLPLGAVNNQSTVSNIILAKPVGLAIGDLMFAHVYTSSSTYNTPTGWTLTKQETGPVHAVFYKVADADDVAATEFVFAIASGTANTGGIMFRVTNQRVVSPVSNSESQNNASSATVTSDGFTPTYPSSLIMFFVAAAEDSRTFGTYALATSSPSFTEHYDEDGIAVCFACASGVRPEMTATGNATAAITGGNAANSGILVAVGPIADATVPDVGLLTLNDAQLASGIITSSQIAVSVINLTGAQPAATESATESGVTNQAKSTTSSVTNLAKS